MTPHNYTPTPGSIPARAIAYLQAQPEGAEVPSTILAEQVGQPTSTLIACLEIAVKHGLLVSRKEAGSVRSIRMWRLGTEEEREAATSRLQSKREQAALERQQERAEDAEAALPPKPTPGPNVLGWTPAKPLYEPPPEPEETVPAVKQDLTPGPAPAEREHHLAQRVWLCSDGQLVVETREFEIVFPRLEAQQLLRTIRGLAELAA